MYASVNQKTGDYIKSYQTSRTGKALHDIENNSQTENLSSNTAQLTGENASFTALVLKIALFMFGCVAILYFASNWYGDKVAKAGHSLETNKYQIVIGNDVINAPSNMIRFNAQRDSTNLERLDLYAHWPSLQGYSEALAEDFDGMADNSPIIYMSLEPRSMSKDMSGRVSSIYEKFFEGPPIDAKNGLVRRAFSSQSAYFSEDLYYEIDSPYPFAARCIRESDKVAAPFCMRDIHVGHDLTLTYRFHTSLLPQWMTLDQAVRKHIYSMIING